jgi:hypothetical protein
MKNTTKKCLDCSNVLTTEQVEMFGHFCDGTCSWFHAERNSRHIGAMYRDSDGDWQDNSL